jgi:hypothetical protein
MVLAIDFDDTIVTTEWPEIKGLRKGAKEVINQLYQDGHQIIIWTCRTDKTQDEAEKFLVANGIMYHRINQNCPILCDKFGNDSRKIGADLYIDDKGILGIPTWDAIYSIVTGRQVLMNYKNLNDE